MLADGVWIQRVLFVCSLTVLASTMPRQWFIRSTNGFKGPFPSTLLRRLAREGKMPPNTAVSHDGENWFKAKKLAGLEFASPQSQTRNSASARTIASSESQPDAWYVKTKKRVIGPILPQRLYRWAVEGKIPPNAAVSHDRISWIKAKRVPGIQFTPSSNVSLDVDLESSGGYSCAAVSLPVIQQPPIPGPLPRFCDLPLRRTDVIRIGLPVIKDIPLFGQLPNLSDISPRRRDIVAIHLPVVQEIPLPGSLQRLGDLPLQRADVIDKELPVIQELPIVGSVPTLSEIQVPTRPKPELGREPLTKTLPATISDANQQRRAAYHQHFGQLLNLNDSNPGGDSQIDICLHPGGPERPFATLVTNGLSDILIDIPSKRIHQIRTELILYVREPDARHISMLKSLASIVTSRHRGFWYGATMSNGDPARPVFADSVLDGFAFMVPPISFDTQLNNTLALQDDPVQVLWVLPISSLERQFVAEHGMGSFCELLNRKKCSPLLDPRRPCFATAMNADDSNSALQPRSQNAG